MAGNYKPVIVLDDNLDELIEPLEKHDFIVLTSKGGMSTVIDDAEELEQLIGGRVFLTPRPDWIADHQLARNFDLVSIPKKITNPEGLAQTLATVVEERELWQASPCWRLDINNLMEVQFKFVED